MRPHPFAGILLAALALAVVAAAPAPDRAPAIALYWNPIYRAEIALVVLTIAYLLAVTGWMAWNGQAFQRLELPGGTALERETAQLDAATTSTDAFHDSVVRRLDELESALDDITDRVNGIEGGRSGGERK